MFQNKNTISTTRWKVIKYNEKFKKIFTKTINHEFIYVWKRDAPEKIIRIIFLK